MSFKDNWLFKSFAILGSSALIFVASASFAQEVIESEEVEATQSTESDRVDTPVEEVVVTGSRLRRSTFTSISPLQVITAEISREAGLVNAADILQTSTSAAGQQIDLTFSGFVLDNGPGTRTISLRGLGANRTLVMVNGRRLAPGGAEGAPYAPNIGLIPAGLVSQYEVLTDGASSVYGSDAIGGVTNIILKKDFDGLVIEGGANSPKYDGGENVNLNLTWGKVWDNGYIGMGLDYNKLDHATYSSRPWTDGCEKNYEVTSDGSFRTEDLFWENARGAKNSDCKYSSMTGYASILGNLWSGLRFYTPGNSNGGIPDWSQFRGPYSGSFYNDTDGDGVSDVSWTDYILNGSEYRNQAFLYPDDETATFMSYGSYTFEGDANVTAYYEMLYSKNDYYQLGRPPQFFPLVPANNPYNICNPNGVRGVDCGLAEDEFLFTNPGYARAFLEAQGVEPAVYYGFLANGPVGPLVVQPVVSVKGDRNSVNAEYQNARFVAGLEGDMPAMEFGTFTNWGFDAYVSYSKSKGESHRTGIRDDRLSFSLGDYSDGFATPCVNDTDTVLSDDVTAGCVPVDMFAPSLLAIGGAGDFATAAERDYLFDSRDFDTEYEQTIVSAIMGGDIYELPNGPVQLSVGFEYRKDEINSMPDDVARDGLFFGYFADGGAVGSKDSKELFFEVEAPILANKAFAKELTVNASARYTDDEFYGSNTTESLKVGWRPVNSLLIRATYGTAFRAPNLRELFLANQTGFNTIGDPCVTPADAYGSGEIGDSTDYDPSLDTREQEVKDNCAAAGVPADFKNSGVSSYSVEQGAGGSLDLDPETSESWTAGFSWEQEMSTEFDFGVSSTYYEVDIDNTIIEPSGAYIVGDCYNNISRNSAFCSRITRGDDYMIDFINQGFINRDNEKGRGVDVNLTFADEFTISDRRFDISVEVNANRQIERSTLYINDDGSADYEDYAGEWGFPKWQGNSTVRVEYDKWRLQLRSNYMSAVDQDPRGIDVFSDIYGNPQADGTTSPASDTCLGTSEGDNDVLCRDVGFTDDYMVHSLSLSYIEDNWAVTLGASNILDKEPPFVDGSEVSSINNTPIGYGYNVFGRSIYLNFAYDLGSN